MSAWNTLGVGELCHTSFQWRPQEAGGCCVGWPRSGSPFLGCAGAQPIRCSLDATPAPVWKLGTLLVSLPSRAPLLPGSRRRGFLFQMLCPWLRGHMGLSQPLLHGLLRALYTWVGLPFSGFFTLSSVLVAYPRPVLGPHPFPALHSRVSQRLTPGPARPRAVVLPAHGHLRYARANRCRAQRSLRVSLILTCILNCALV